MSSKIRILGADDVRKCCTMPQAIEAMKVAFSNLSAGKADVPLRTNLPVTEQTQSLCMPVSIDNYPTFGLKAVSITTDNNDRGLPMIHGVVLLFDSTTGEPRCLIDGEFLTSLRTGAASGLATDLLADPAASHLVVFGTGRQATSQVEAVVAVRTIETVTIVSRSPERAREFCDTLRNFGDFDFTCTSDATVVATSDVICTATPSKEPLFDGNDLPKQCHINAVGSYRYDMCEIEPELLTTMSILVDERESSFKEAGEIVQAIQRHLIQTSDVIELGKLLLSDKAIDVRKRTLFKSVGNAVQDLVVANSVLNQAIRLGLGQQIEV
jgi:ornithine cyclodeaminase/alanine dehydrogenase-like protein (mu-crystallin family)